MNADNGAGRDGLTAALKRLLRDTGMDAVSCMLMALGIMLSFDQLFRFHAPLPVMIFHTVLFTAAFVLLTRRAWVLPALLGGLLLLFLLLGLIPGSGLFEWARGFGKWWGSLFPARSSYNTAGNIALVQFLVHLGIVGLLYFSVRLVRSVWIIGSAAVFYYAIAAAFDYTDYMIPSILLLLMGLIPLLARNYIPFSGGRIRLLLSSRRLQAAALAIGCVCCLLAWALLPADTASWRVLDGKMNVSGFGSNTIVQLSPTDLYTIGLQPDLSRLGGNISLNDTTPVMRVSASLPMLMKSNIYEEYTGSGWTNSAIEAYKWGTGTEAEKAFGWYLPSGSDAEGLYRSTFQEQSAQVILMQRSSSLFYFGDLLDLNLENRDAPFYNKRGEVFSDSTLYRDDIYRFQARDKQRRGDNGGNFDLLVTYLEQSMTDTDPYYADIVHTYTALPSIPARVSDTAWDVAGGQPSPYLKAVRLEEYLQSSGFRYTLTPGHVPRNRDFVDYFLETQEGYCTYFASAMTVMARSLGIPARLVSGYGLQYRDEEGYWVALRKNAHAWVECYFYGIGWITFDPTAGVPYSDPTGVPLPSVSNIPQNTSAPPGPSSSGTSPAGTSSGAGHTTTTHSTVPQPDHEKDGPSARLVLLLFLLAAVTLLLLLLLWRIHRHATIYQLSWVRRRFAHNAARAAHYYTDMLHQLELLGYTPQAGETLLRFVTRMAGDDTLPDQAVREAFGIIMDWKYGEQSPADEDVVRMAAAHDELEACVRRKLKAVPYFFHRVLMG